MKTYLSIAVVAMLSVPVSAAATTFTFGPGANSETYTDTVDGITLSATAGLYSGDTITNLDADGLFFARQLSFDSDGIGVTGDRLAIDGGDIDGTFANDLLTFDFGQVVDFDTVEFSSFDSDDDFDLFVDGAFIGAGEFNIAAENPYDLSGLSGTSISFGADGNAGLFRSGDSFRIASITVSDGSGATGPAPVPLPAGALLLLSGLGAGLVLRKRKR